MKPEPVTVSVVAAPPAASFVGLIELMLGVGVVELPPPPPEPPAHPAREPKKDSVKRQDERTSRNRRNAELTWYRPSISNGVNVLTRYSRSTDFTIAILVTG